MCVYACLRLRKDYFKALLRQDMSWIDVNQPGEAASRLAEDTVTFQVLLLFQAFAKDRRSRVARWEACSFSGKRRPPSRPGGCRRCNGATDHLCVKGAV